MKKLMEFIRQYLFLYNDIDKTFVHRDMIDCMYDMWNSYSDCSPLQIFMYIQYLFYFTK